MAPPINGSLAVALTPERSEDRISRPSARLDATPAPAWQAQAKLMQFLLGARGPEEVTHRAAAGLGLLPQVAWAEVTADTTPCEGTLVMELQAANGGSTSGPTALRVGLSDPTDDNATAFLRSLFQLAAAIYHREAENARLADAAHTDPLTGLWNRRGFVPFLDQALARFARTGESIALLLCDLDHFKGINDLYGHDAGDQALTAVADAIRTVIRPSDLGARIGGDEIAILLSGADATGALAVANRLRETTAAVNPLTPHPLTLSIGIADIAALVPNQAGVSPREALTRAADQALYQAKHAGRNQAAIYGAGPEPGAVSAIVEDDTTAVVDVPFVGR